MKAVNENGEIVMVPISEEKLLDDIRKLGRLHCTYEEIGAWLASEYDVGTINLDKGDIEYFFRRNEKARAAYEAGKAEGKISLRRVQMHKALKEGDVTAMIWLGKQILGQTDKTRNELVGEDGGPIRVALESAAEKLERFFAEACDGGSND